MKLPGYIEYDKQNNLKISMSTEVLIVKISGIDFANNILNNIVNYERIAHIDTQTKTIYFDEEADDSNISIKYELIEVLSNDL